MKNEEVIHLLNTVADILEIRGDDDLFKILAYRRAARSVEDLAEDIEALHRQGRLGGIPGFGAAITEKVKEFLDTGHLQYLEKIAEGFPPGLLEIVRIPGLGPKKAQALWRELGVTTVDQLREACERHRVQRLKGFGEKTEEKILAGIRILGEAKGRTLISEAWHTAEAVLAHLRANPAVERVTAAGSLRRMKETVGDLDFLVLSDDPATASRAFTSMPLVESVVVSGDTKSTVILQGGLQADLRVLDRKSWGSGLQYFTGSKDHNVRLRGLAQSRGLKLSEYGLFRGDDAVAGETEEGIYEALGMRYIEPELREDGGEIAAASAGTLPTLVRHEDIRGDFHAHTRLTDGVNSLEEMAAEAQRLGYAYVGLSEHSQSLTIARGIDPDQVRLRKKEIEGFNRRSPGIQLLFGTECDILKDGSMDYPDDVLKDFDYVVASVHSQMKLPRDEQTQRVLTAIADPYVNILAHPTTRKIGQRDPIDIDLEKVFEAAAQNGTAVEINSGGNRMDLTGAQAKLAKEMGCVIATDTDAHSTGELHTMRFAVGLARRGWLEAKDVVNTWDLSHVRDLFR